MSKQITNRWPSHPPHEHDLDLPILVEGLIKFVAVIVGIIALALVYRSYP